MYIHEVIIDGFKSYAQKTVVSGFDPQFNAITGLNGSGKSNILDSICFVLGISNLTQVRVGNLQELVYKQGQAGVTKASVTVVFNNDDPSSSPVGYESHKQITVTRQVVLGGKNKYMINGHTVQQSQVQNLFHSVQLNVNNPHFLIMQGRITKVLNMKPQEILSMIEEAAGTRMFETKKQAAIKTIEKKQLKVEEITKCMSDEITPTLEGLRGERQNYLSWQSNNTELERLERFCIAAEFKDAEDQVRDSEDDKRRIASELQSFETLQTEKTNEASECTRQITALEKLRESDLESGLAGLKKTESDLSKELVKAKTTLANHSESLHNEKESLAALHKALESAKAAAVEKQSEFDVCGVTLKHKELEANDSEAQAVALREKYQNACAGVADDAASSALLSLPEQVATWEKKAREAHSQLQQSTLKAAHAKETAKDLRKQLKSQQSVFDAASKERETIQASVSKLESQLGSHANGNGNSSEAAESALRARVDSLKQEQTTLRDRVDTLGASVGARLQFEYKDPEKGFDRTNRVKGLVASLVRVKPTETRACAALEIAAGAKLFQVIVDSEHTGKLLLQRGQLKKRVTILPLNKVSYRVIEQAKLDRAYAIAASMRGTAALALDLVTFDESVRKAMEYTFGNVLVCDSAEVARAIAYDKSVACRTVTLDGDSFDPSGTVTGGSTSHIGVLLSQREELETAKERLAAAQAEWKDASRRLEASEQAGNATRDLIAQLDVKRHALALCQEKLASSSYGQLHSEIQALENQLKMHEEEQEMLKEAFKRANDELKKVKDAETSVKKDREKAMKEMEGQVKAAAKAANAVKAEVAKLKSKRDAISAELTGLEKEVEALKEQIASCEGSIAKMSKEADALTAKSEQAMRAYESAQQALKGKQDELNQCSKEIKGLMSARDKCQKAAHNASLEARKVQHKLQKWEKDFKDASKNMSVLLKQHPWIEKERAFFGLAGSDFDFAAKDVNQAAKRLQGIKADQDKLSKKINKKVMGMIEKAENEYEDLRRKKEVILNDKSKIEAVIEELDVKKSQALQTTWIKVNRDFGSIFSMLLPGTHAKLEPPEGGTVSDGLEVKVAFNSVWKDSLTELSGGQRSLLALSLILALLLFKPAPMYILDEVDAALDLSHTQNIGLMLRTHFSSSQFIVVSLKEGMFNNANVIFRTKFVDGVSTVSRTVLNSRSAGQLGSAGKAAAGGSGGKATATAAKLQIEDVEESIRSPQKKKGKSGVKKVAAAGRENAIEA